MTEEADQSQTRLGSEENDLHAEDSGNVRDALLDYLRAWGSRDLEALTSSWAQDDDSAYMGEEIDSVLLGGDVISAHLARSHGRLSDVSVTMSRFWSRSLGPDYALAVVVLAWRVAVVESSAEPRTSHSRATVLYIKKSGCWRISHWMEENYHMADGAGSAFARSLHS